MLSLVDKHEHTVVRKSFSSYGIIRNNLKKITCSTKKIKSDFGKMNFDYIVM
jgi:hypothetical protein